MKIANNNNNNNFLADLLAQSQKKVESIQKMQQQTAAERADILHNKTVLFVNVAQRGYVGIMGYSMDGAVEEAPDIKRAANPRTGKNFTSAESTMAGFHGIFKNILEGKYEGKDHFVIYANEFERRRVTGMLSRIKKGSNEILTEKELSYIGSSDASISGRFGENYKEFAKTVFLDIKAACEKGYTIQFMPLGSIGAYPLRTRLPQDLEGRTVELKGGFGTIFHGRQSFPVRLDNNVRLSGKHKLIMRGGRIAVERPIEPGSSQEALLTMFRATSQLIIYQNAVDNAGSVPEEAAGEATDAGYENLGDEEIA